MQLELNDVLERLLEDFINFRETNVDDGSQIKASYNSPEEMEQAFEEWVGDLVHQFTSETDWEQITAEYRESNES